MVSISARNLSRQPEPEWESGKRDGFFSLLFELIGLMLRHRWLLLLAILPNIVKPAFEPVQAWLVRDVLKKLTRGTSTYTLTDLLHYAPLAVGIFLALGLLSIWEKMSNRMLDDRLLITLQRTWFDRRPQVDPAEQSARAFYDCENARKPLDLFQKELWMVVIGLPSVFIWQLSLDATLLPAMLVAAIPPFLVALLFGGFIGRASRNVLIAFAAIGRAVGRGRRDQLHDEQEKFYRHRVRFEMWKQSSEIIADFAGWAGIAAVLILSWSGLWKLLPQEVTPSQIGLFLVNLKLLNKPLSEAAKVYNKVREGWPAVQRVLRPNPDAEEDTSSGHGATGIENG